MKQNTTNNLIQKVFTTKDLKKQKLMSNYLKPKNMFSLRQDNPFIFLHFYIFVKYN